MLSELGKLERILAEVKDLAQETKEIYSKLKLRKLLTENQLGDEGLQKAVDMSSCVICIVISTAGDPSDQALKVIDGLMEFCEHRPVGDLIKDLPRESGANDFIVIKHSASISVQRVDPSRETEALDPLLQALSTDNVHTLGCLAFGPYAGLLKGQLIIVLLRTRLDLTSFLRWLKENCFTMWLHIERNRISDIISRKDTQPELGETFTDRLKMRILHFSSVANTIQQAQDFILPTLKDHLVHVIQPLQCSLKRCYSSVIDTLSLMSADRRRTEMRLNFVAERELHLYSSLLELTNRKQREIAQIVRESVNEAREHVQYFLISGDRPGNDSSNYDSNGTDRESLVDSHCHPEEVERFVLNNLNGIMSTKILKASDVLRQDFTGTLMRCLSDLEQGDPIKTSLSCQGSASQALCQILSSMYHIDLDIFSCVNLFRFYFEKFRLAFIRLRDPVIPKREVADTILNSISERKIASSVCRRLNEQIVLSHRLFSQVISEVGDYHNTRLATANETQRTLKKEFAPTIALLQLRAYSLAGLTKYGRPIPDKELGRGYYGVVYSCAQWGPYKNLALKSVVPFDEKHLKDTALEFNANMAIPIHPRIIEIFGCILCPYASSHTQKQLLILMERMEYDLHHLLEAKKLEFYQRLSIACDVIEGIRYLHRLGLIHRDIKLKNVLLNKEHHAKITDMGFCKPEVLMDGSVVGTPSHMAPELLSTKYDNSVDIYAYGILLWHLLAGEADLPKNFAEYRNPPALWLAVKEGLRPERPKNVVDDRCWDLAERCWAGEAQLRPTAGEIEESIREALERIKPSKDK